MAKWTVTMGVCERCGESFEQRGKGRPRLFCVMCTPRSAEDKTAARVYWAEVHSERARARNAEAREQLAMLRERRPGG